MVLSNYGDKDPAKSNHHIIHLHGHDFVVIKTGFPVSDPNTGEFIKNNEDLYCVDELCREMHWTNYTETANTFETSAGPLQDTVLIPYGGYTVVRILTDNPGFWLMHCHHMMHALEGMDVVIKVAPEKAPPPPINFPDTCGGDFTYSHDDFIKSITTTPELTILPRFYDEF